MVKERYIYPAIFDYADDGISIEFPDLPGCITCGDTEEEALHMAKEALALHLYGMEQEGMAIPEPSKISQIKAEPNQAIVLIEVWMPPFRDRMEEKAVKKTLTIPKWLNDMAEERKVNFSQVLQAALKEYLGLEGRHRQ
ncbi:putative RNase H-like HicB family nuclease [Desulfofundulus luciae]|uniref:RNase H-like HicB family nuclease n=1 Tax=Desulfofundulus luciae TaxID=74702 RepID=A0ABU0B2W4_9FIRM|nr:type II toxin-antitoxin system HicB family antitoxin [Desulfofundulus luciae]MDQ0286612.1 putative RNase H-like HicB family nuclease [Desulfofundulus luciae]